MSNLVARLYLPFLWALVKLLCVASQVIADDYCRSARGEFASVLSFLVVVAGIHAPLQHVFLFIALNKLPPPTPVPPCPSPEFENCDKIQCIHGKCQNCVVGDVDIRK